MGRSTTPLKQVVYCYLERWNRVIELMDQREADCIRKVLEDIDSTISLFTHVGAVDPMELILLHVLRKLACKEIACG